MKIKRYKHEEKIEVLNLIETFEELEKFYDKLSK